MISTNQQMKRLTKIRLINWHFFIDELINVNGSVLFSGENASGKSTILDAIQLVLTANSGHFNPAANEKSKRDLRGYVRCKTGEEGNTYVRGSGAVISYIALEFYEESKNRYFVIGVKLDSPDIESDITKKWFCVEGELDALSFVINGKPATDKEFTQNGKKIPFEYTDKRARETFRNRLGRLDDKFPELLSKSMAFKPMNKVKDFINQFILPASNIDTEALQNNIRNLKEMQKLINDVREQISQLKTIINKADEIDSKEYDILVIDIMIQIAIIKNKEEDIRKLQVQKEKDQSILTEKQKELRSCQEELETIQNKVNDLKVAIKSNENGQLIEQIKGEIESIKRKKAEADDHKKQYCSSVENIRNAVNTAKLLNASCGKLSMSTTSSEERIEILESIRNALSTARDTAYKDKTNAESETKQKKDLAIALEDKISELKKNRIPYDTNTEGLRDAINEEFKNRKIESEARVFADLLEIKLEEWRNAVEGYLNTQRFYIIVDPKYYDIASNVYDRMKSKIHSVGLINAGKIPMEETSDISGTLAEAVSSENRYARAYINYVLGRVVRCDTVEELKTHKIAITKTCMKYQGHVLSKIAPDVYNNPYIGQYARKIQFENAEKELSDINTAIDELNERVLKNDRIINAINECDFTTAKNFASAEEDIRNRAIELQKAETELSEAMNDPTLVDLQMKLDAAEKAHYTKADQEEQLSKVVTNKERDIEEHEKKLIEFQYDFSIAIQEKDHIAKDNARAFNDAEKKFSEEYSKKSAETIITNYGPRRQTLENQKNKLREELVSYQTRYKDGDFGTGMEVIKAYRDDLEKLEKSDLISYEDKLAAAQEDCELEFRENFLAKLRENIDRAKTIFSQLNKSLNGIYYGNDSYRFELTPNREKQHLYDMITSDFNYSGQTLFTFTFEEQYHSEMDELFSKLTDENLSGSANELTDYRSYLDYDIKIISKDGKVQFFSKTYGEKSGGETQTPYYVAIAASFTQLYSDRETARIVVFDEAFNNMDEDRIESMMDFFDTQHFQIILATPPARMEIIGEHMDSIYLTIHSPKQNVSTVEEYFL